MKPLLRALALLGLAVVSVAFAYFIVNFFMGPAPAAS